jgi:serine/threonine protein kinase
LIDLFGNNIDKELIQKLEDQINFYPKFETIKKFEMEEFKYFKKVIGKGQYGSIYKGKFYNFYKFLKKSILFLLKNLLFLLLNNKKQNKKKKKKKGTLTYNNKEYEIAIKKLNKIFKLKKLPLEITNLFLCDNKYIVKFYGYAEDEKNIYYLYEYMSECDLKKQIENLNDFEKIKFSYEVCVGMNYIHEKHGIVHRDLKAENILLKGFFFI